MSPVAPRSRGGRELGEAGEGSRRVRLSLLHTTLANDGQYREVEHERFAIWQGSIREHTATWSGDNTVKSGVKSTRGEARAGERELSHDTT